MINFTVGPVQSSNLIKEIGSQEIPYFRTSEFSEIMKENENLILEFSKAHKNSRAIFLTASGTGAMEATIINTLTKDDKVLVVNGGSFGERFVEILELYEIEYTEIKLDCGKKLTYEHLEKFENKGYTGFLVNIHETSSGVYYDATLISEFCKKNNLFLIVDAISSFLADKFNMEGFGVDIMIVGSQKALACPPGISIVVLSEKAIQRVKNMEIKSYYFNFKRALEDGKRGQTPFTPAVGILLQINKRLKEIKENGGVESEIRRTEYLAKYFREKIKEFPFTIISESMSNALTALYSNKENAMEIVNVLKNEYNIWVCPNGGEFSNKIFRIGHIGNLTKNDYDVLIKSFEDLEKRKII